LLHDEAGTTKALIKIAAIYAVKSNYTQARVLAQQALRTATSIDSKEDIKDACIMLAEIYRDLNDYRQAYDYLERASQVKDSLYDASVAEQVAELQLKYESEKKDLLLQQKLSTIRHQRMITRILAGATLIVVIFFIFGVIEYWQKRRAYRILEVQKKNITDSINYASKIQSALLPPEALLRNLLPDSFVLYMPKEVVSGDFYWVAAKEGKTIVAVADCTGHGLSGALLTIAGTAFLNEIINYTPLNAAEFLNQLRQRIMRLLHQRGMEGEAADGMDISLAIIDCNGQYLQYAGANNPAYLVRTSGELVIIPADRMPIGIHDNCEIPFTNHNITFERGDMLYLFSDGYADQFGGPHDQKFRTKRFQELCKNIYHLPTAEQRVIFERTIDEWMGYRDQVDDISIIGIRF
jgi:serine phosphatase RsbU (regulator of sigma subunit)